MSAARRVPDWLEVMDGGAPILLIAPHGGRAGPHAEAALAPRVNDLHTAELTRELARRLDAAALINAGMDRNRVDCNRLGEVAAHAPWLLAMIAERLERMVAARGRATVLAIHGWNLVEPRVDIGVGLIERAGGLAPSRGAHVSVSDRFLGGTLAALVERLERAGIASTFGLRYPAGAAHNLVQAFTGRHLENADAAIQRLAGLGARGLVDAVQIELSLALRFPGALRELAIAGLSEVLSNGVNGAASGGAHPPRARHPDGAPPAERPRPATRRSARLGFEFYDPASRIGAMASFDLGAGGGGGRVMILTPAGGVALFTGERGGRREPDSLRVGPLRLHAGGARPRLEFTGPMLLTPDAAVYVDIERALALSSLEAAASFTIDFALDAPFDLEAVRAAVETEGARAIAVRFGSFAGRLRLGAYNQALSGVARIGPAFSGLEDGGFEARRMLWAIGADGDARGAVQAAERRVDGQWRPNAAAGAECRIVEFDPPRPIRAAIARVRGPAQALIGRVVNLVPLMRSDSHDDRFHTTLGFAEFTRGRARAFGMFETSRRVAGPAPAADAESDAS